MLPMVNGRLMTRRKLIWTALLVVALALVFAAVPLVRPYWVAKYRGEGADLAGAMLYRAPLAGANLFYANLSGAKLRRADLRGASIIIADLRGADLRGANLTGAILWEADLTGAILQGANLQGAYYVAETRWPEGFDPQAAGAVLVE